MGGSLLRKISFREQSGFIEEVEIRTYIVEYDDENWD